MKITMYWYCLDVILKSLATTFFFLSAKKIELLGNLLLRQSNETMISSKSSGSYGDIILIVCNKLNKPPKTLRAHHSSKKFGHKHQYVLCTPKT